jgi:putative ABC transport system substrate-binding protein
MDAYVSEKEVPVGKPRPRVSAVTIMEQATCTIRVVFVQTSDPVGSGFVTGLAPPGGNTTGFTNFEPDMSGKRLGLFKEATPNRAPASATRSGR